MPSSFSTDARDLVLKLLCKDPSARIGSGPTNANEIRKHHFFKVNATLLLLLHVRCCWCCTLVLLLLVLLLLLLL